MCVIIVKLENSELSEKQYMAAFDNNPHGWGIMTAEHGRVIVRRGMSKKAYRRALKAVRGKQAIIHTRWATHGAKVVENCHPFKVTDNIYIAHNGVVRTDMIESERSDSYNFATYVLRPILEANPKLFGTSQLAKHIKELAGDYNKFAMMRSDGEILIVNESAGTWINEGIWVSNLRSLVPLPPPEPRRAAPRKPKGGDAIMSRVVSEMTIDRDGKQVWVSRWLDKDGKEYRRQESPAMYRPPDPKWVADNIHNRDNRKISREDKRDMIDRLRKMRFAEPKERSFFFPPEC